jgi:hypothetical protein
MKNVVNNTKKPPADVRGPKERDAGDQPVALVF